MIKVSDITADLSPEQRQLINVWLWDNYDGGDDFPRRCGPHTCMGYEYCTPDCTRWNIYPCADVEDPLDFCSSVDAALALAEKMGCKIDLRQPWNRDNKLFWLVGVTDISAPQWDQQTHPNTCHREQADTLSDLAPAILRCLLRNQGIEKLEV